MKLYKYRCGKTEFSQRQFIVKNRKKEQDKCELGKVDSYDVHSQFCSKMKQRGISMRNLQRKAGLSIVTPQIQYFSVFFF